ncbi:MAG: 30S ribosomal protein S4 [Synergistetes bacterium]|nr:MAG: 30S ribosomal protein S4 [bacterium 42_11]MBC7331666.1 30S ribosomal protein S4 [Synergistota bacterium]MDK2872013.1 small subunit ribosomal protein [bacterium]
MSKYIGPICRLCRTEGVKLFLKGEKCSSDKCPMVRRPFFPGMHGRERRRKLTEYGLRLREKQKLRKIYGMREKQFERFFEMATKQAGMTGDNFLKLLERRLDNVVFRLGFAPSRRAARQIVNHGHVLVNGKKVTTPSYLVDPGDVIEIRPQSKELEMFKNISSSESTISVPSWLEVDIENLRGRVVSLPEIDQIDTARIVNLQLVVEFYSR